MGLALTEKIKDKYGSLKFYAKKRKLSYNSLKVVVSKGAGSKPVIEQLKKDGFIE